MIARFAFAVALAAAVAGTAAPVAAEEKPASAPAPGGGLDATPDKSAPDPLTPPEQKITPLAPGAAADEKPAEQAQAPEPQPDPFATAILAKLASAGGKGDAREDVAGLAEFYRQKNGQPIWTASTHKPRMRFAKFAAPTIGDSRRPPSSFRPTSRPALPPRSARMPSSSSALRF
jgi:hypothetical protein